MNDYIELILECDPFNEDIADLLADYLGEIGYDSFENKTDRLLAYIPQSDFNIDNVNEILKDFPINTTFKISSRFIKGKNWNEEWEKNYFKPMVIAGQCVVHSSFHKDYSKAEYDITIDPRMAFGTGHHSTTSGMMSLILGSEMEGKTIIDLGTGTGILAILSRMKGAAAVHAIEIDPNAFENACQNAELNNCDISFYLGGAEKLNEVPAADYFFANINRNVILNDAGEYIKKIKPGGSLFLSGFYSSDIPTIDEAIIPMGFEQIDMKEDKNWVALHYKKSV